MSIDGRMDAADRKNSAALKAFENKWGAGAETAAERKQMAADQAKLSATTGATSRKAANDGRKQLADQQRALAGKKAKKRVMPLPKGAGKTATKGGLKPLPKGGWEELSNLTDDEKRKIYRDMGVEGY